MLPDTILEARADVHTAHQTFLTAINAYIGAVGRQADSERQQELLAACRHAADAYDATLLHLVTLLSKLPPSSPHQAEQAWVRSLQRQLAHHRRVLSRNA